MKITEYKGRLQLEPPKFCCDRPLCKRDIDPFENRSFFTVFVGQPRSGKTSHMISSLLSKRVYNKVFDHIYVFMPTNNLIILDDMAVFLKNNAVAKLLTYIILNRRHLRVSIMMTVQYFNSMPLPIRKNISSIVLANKPVNKKELDSITEELFSMDQKDSIDVLKYCFQKPYDKFHCVLEPLQYYRNLNRLEITGTDVI